MKILNYTLRIEQDDDLSSDELAELFGLQVALNTYKNLYGVSGWDNRELFDYLGLEGSPDNGVTRIGL